jgi:hypothetical protein
MESRRIFRKLCGFYYRQNPSLLSYNQTGVEAGGLFQPLIEQAASGDGGEGKGEEETGGWKAMEHGTEHLKQRGGEDDKLGRKNRR